jgi:hypothetical protein
VVSNLVAYRLDDVQPEAVAIVPEVAHKCVAKNQDLVWQATAPEERHTTTLGADVHAVRVVLGTAIRDDDRNVLEGTLELGRQLVECCTNQFLEFSLTVMLVIAHGFVIAPSIAHPPRSRRQRIAARSRYACIEGSAAVHLGVGIGRRSPNLCSMRAIA